METAVVQLLIQYRYFIIFPLTIVEGPVIMMASGFLLRFGYFELWSLYLTLLAADLIGDVFWYCAGYFGGMRFIRRYGKYFSITEAGIKKVEGIFHRHHSAILISSKVTMGFGFAVVTLFTAGLTRIPFMRYLAFNVIGGIIWTGILLAVGYYLGDVYLTVGRGLEIVTIGAIVVMVLLVVYGVGKYVRTKF